jgi:hypothetical protein
MNWKNLLWRAFRIVYLVCCVWDVSVLSVWICPPKDGNNVHTLEGLLIINTLVVVIGWALLPWPKPEPIFKKTPPAPIPEAKLEDVCGQGTLEDYLEKRRGQQ